MFAFVKRVSVVAIAFLSFNGVVFNPMRVKSLECIAMTNQMCKIRPKIVDINNNEPVFYPFSVKLNKCSGSCNNINDPYAKIYVPNIVKNINAKVFNLMSF